LTVELNLHRPLAPDMRVKDLELVLVPDPRLTVLTKHRWHARSSRLIVSGERPPGAAPTHRGALLAINFGWRLIATGLRVATIVDDRAEPEFLILPERFLGFAAALRSLRSERDTALNEVRPVLRRIPFAAAPAALADGLALALAPRFGPSRLARLVALWQKDHGDWRPDELAPLAAWRRLDNTLYSRQDRTWRRLVGGRTDIYRCWAKAICSRAGTLLIDNVDYAALRRLPLDEAPELPAVARRNRDLAAVGEVIAALRSAARHTGTVLVEQPGPSTATWCHVGDHALEVPAELRAELRYFCGRCGTNLDMDVNNALFRLRRQRFASAPAAAPGPAPLA
jgi:hypothetical protein